MSVQKGAYPKWYSQSMRCRMCIIAHKIQWQRAVEGFPSRVQKKRSTDIKMPISSALKTSPKTKNQLKNRSKKKGNN